MVFENLGINTAGFDLTTTVQTAYIIGIVAVVLLVLAVFVFVLLTVLKYDVKAIIEEKHLHGTIITTKKAKIGYDRNKKSISRVEKIFLFGQRFGMPIMPPTHILESIQNKEKNKELVQKRINEYIGSCYGITNKGKKAIRLIKIGNEYTVIPFADASILDYLQVSKPVRLQWLNNMIKEGDQMFTNEPSFWQQYGSMVMFGGAMIIIMIIFIVLFNQLGKLETISAAINNQAAAMNEYVKVLRELTVQPIK
jgi:hypothetical protein